MKDYYMMYSSQSTETGDYSMHIKRIFYFMAIIISISILLFYSCTNQEKNDREAVINLKGSISISGAWALYPMMVRWTEEFSEIHGDVRFDVSPGSAGRGMTDVLAGRVDIGMVSRSITPSEQSAGTLSFPVVRDTFVATMNADNPLIDHILKRGMKRQTFQDLWIKGKLISWDQIYPDIHSAGKYPIHVYTRCDASGAADTWAGYLGSKKEDLLGVGVNSEPSLATYIRRDIYAIGFNNINYIYDSRTKRSISGLQVVPIDIDNNGRIDPEEDIYEDRDAFMAAIENGQYPPSLVRAFHLVTRGAPKRPVVKEFIRWILTEGQGEYVSQSGYINLHEDVLKDVLRKIE